MKVMSLIVVMIVGFSEKIEQYLGCQGRKVVQKSIMETGIISDETGL